MTMGNQMKWVFATNNSHKISEAQAIVGTNLNLISLQEAGIDIDVDETGTTFEANALLKAQAIFELTGMPCVADDSGLCVNALNGAPGVYSARYGGEPVNHRTNNEKLLTEMQGVQDRRAQFKTVLCVVGLPKMLGGGSELYQPLFFEGVVAGEILTVMNGAEGFGYDPLFRPEGYEQTFAEMLAEQKNALSHRGKAFFELMRFLSIESGEGSVL
jgi:XTP/dITP diphosphohydrolase